METIFIYNFGRTSSVPASTKYWSFMKKKDIVHISATGILGGVMGVPHWWRYSSSPWEWNKRLVQVRECSYYLASEEHSWTEFITSHERQQLIYNSYGLFIFNFLFYYNFILVWQQNYFSGVIINSFTWDQKRWQ